MVPRSLRLGRQGFEQSGSLPRTATPHFSISYGTLPNAAGIGVIVPKKVVKSSVERHQLKRRVREIARELVVHQNISKTALIIVTRAGASKLSFDELKRELSEVFKAILAKKV